MPTITLEEAQADLEATNRDIEALHMIITGLRTLVHQSHGEDRAFLKLDLMKYDTYKTQALKLKVKIHKILNNLINNL